MQKTHLIALTLVAMFMLLGFNIINSRPNPEPVTSEATATPPITESRSAPVIEQPLGEQPKAMMDKATNQIEQAQKADAERLTQLDDVP